MIACEDVVASFVDAQRPSYYALSYVWGNPKDLLPITFNGSTFMITRNLWHALRQLRADKTVEKSYLWIDAICIDQTDNQERNHQVSAMGQLYSSAAEVIVWLGEGSEHGYYIMEFLCRFEEAGPKKMARSDVKRFMGSTSPSGSQAIQTLLNVQYWKRIWIIQEIVLA
ncbi:heterokaryon incompatibility, partial [Mytilinidion resinicola]